MDLKKLVRNLVNEGYELIDAQSKVSQDIILMKINKSNFKNHITIKGGVVMHSISNSIRRATRDLDMDFIKYSLDDLSIKGFINKLDNVKDEVSITIIEKIVELNHQDYNGKRVYLKIEDKYGYSIKTKLDIGVHKLFEIEQEDYYFNLNGIEESISLLINSPEQLFAEKLKSLLKLGIRCTRYKDLFDFYYLISNNKLNEDKLLKALKIIIFDDEKMKENNIKDILERLNKIFSSKIYRSNLKGPKVNWLDISVEETIDCILVYMNELEKIYVAT